MCAFIEDALWSLELQRTAARDIYILLDYVDNAPDALLSKIILK